jgi:hypothetical protein
MPTVSDLRVLDAPFAYPRASQLAMAALATYGDAALAAMGTLEPNYQRISEAELAWDRRQQRS